MRSELPSNQKKLSIILYVIIGLFFGCQQSDKKNNVSINNIPSDSLTQTTDSLITINPVGTDTTEAIKSLDKNPKLATSKPSIPPKRINYSLRKHSHVKELCKDLSGPLIEICVAKQVPPAAILAIIALESGWGSGYIGQITGNILSLNATKSSPELPALYLPVIKKTGRVLFDPNEIDKYKPEQLEYQNRPSSLKRDYRPSKIAGTTHDLAYFKYHHDEKVQAEIRCITDFISRFVSYNSSIAAYREARTQMDKHVANSGFNILFEEQVAIEFINMIGGKPNSFNFRETWPKKVESVMHKTGLVPLMKDIYINKKTLEEVW